MSCRKKEEYLKVLEEQIRCRKARSQVVKEIRGHIEEQEAFYLSEGLTRKEAEEEAVKEMGDPVEAGAALDLVHRPRMTWGFIALVSAVYLAGFVILNLLQQNFSGTIFISADHVKWFVMGAVILIGVCYVDYSRVGYWAAEITAVLFVALLAGMALFGQQVNGAWQWIGIPFISVSVNVRLLCFLFVPLYGAVLYRFCGQGYRAVGKGVLWMFPAVFIALRTPSLFTAAELVLIFMVILSFAVYEGWFAVSKVRALGLLWGGAGLLAGAVWLRIFMNGESYQWHRLEIFMGRRESYYGGILQKIYEGCRMVGGGEGAETIKSVDGLLEGMDFGLTYIAAGFGIAAAVAVIGFLLCLVICLAGMSVRQKNRIGNMMGFGCCAAFLIQIVFYVLGNTGFLPFGSMYCPFLTCGGTGILVTNVLLGILISIYRYQDIPLKTEKNRLKWGPLVKHAD